MKKILLLILVFVFVEFNIILVNGQNLDENGFQIPFSIPHSEVSYPSFQSFTSTNSYDSIRALTEINTSDADAYPWISPDGLRLYYTSGMYDNRLMFTQRFDTNGFFLAPTIVPLDISDPIPGSYWLSSDELDVYICSDSVYYAHRNSVDSAFNTPILIQLSQPFIYKGASLNNAQTTLYVSAFDIGYRGILEFTRTSPTSFSYTRTLSLPLGYLGHTGQLSKDELTYFVSASLNGSNQLLYQISRLTPNDTFDVSTFQLISSLNNLSIDNSQPSMSDSLSWVAFVRNSTGLWTGNDLYIANKGGTVNSVFDSFRNKILFSVFPNPSNGKFNLIFNERQKVMLKIFNGCGECIHQQECICETNEKIPINIEKENKGIYLVQVSTHDKIYTRKIIVE